MERQAGGCAIKGDKVSGSGPAVEEPTTIADGEDVYVLRTGSNLPHCVDRWKYLCGGETRHWVHYQWVFFWGVGRDNLSAGVGFFGGAPPTPARAHVMNLDLQIGSLGERWEGGGGCGHHSTGGTHTYARPGPQILGTVDQSRGSATTIRLVEA